MPNVMCQAFAAYAAARLFSELPTKVKLDHVPSMYVHTVANRSDDCRSYDTHKYVPKRIRQQVDEIFGVPEGSGIYGFWSFKDGSKLYVLCGDNYVMSTDDGNWLLKLDDLPQTFNWIEARQEEPA